MQEGGFLMPNPGTVFIHYEIHHADPLIIIMGRERDVTGYEQKMEEAVGIIRSIIDRGL